MDKDQLYAIEWLKAHDLISHRALEKRCGFPQGALYKALKGVRDLPPHYVPLLCFELKTYGFKPYRDL